MPNIPYNRPGRRSYLSITKHQRTASAKYSRWLNINVERLVFDNADFGNFQHDPLGISWIDNDCLWGFLQNHEKVGTKGEQFGFFVGQVNPLLEWHGYPAIPFSIPRLNISPVLIERWVAQGVLDQDDVPPLLNKRRL